MLNILGGVVQTLPLNLETKLAARPKALACGPKLRLWPAMNRSASGDKRPPGEHDHQSAGERHHD